MSKRVKEFADQNGATFYPVHPTHETVLGVRCYPTIADVPGDIDLAVILTGKAVDTFEEVLAKKAKFAVIFAAGFSETGKEGEKLEARLAGLVRSGETRLLGPNTNLNVFSEFEDLPGPSIALDHPERAPGSPGLPGPGDRDPLSHWAPTGNEVDLEFADFARYFADQPEVGVVACYIEGFKDGRTLMLAADHAARLHKPIVIVKVGRTDEGRRWPRPTPATSPAPTPSSRRCSASSASPASTASTSCSTPRWRSPARSRRTGVPDPATASASTRSRAAPARTWPTWSRPRACSSRPLTQETQRKLHDGLIPAYLRVSNPVDCGGPPVATPAAARSSTRSSPTRTSTS